MLTYNLKATGKIRLKKNKQINPLLSNDWNGYCAIRKEKCVLSTHDIQAACTSQTVSAPRGTLQDLTSASSVEFVFPAHMSHYIYSRQTRVTACTRWYLKTHNICAESSLLCWKIPFLCISKCEKVSNSMLGLEEHWKFFFNTWTVFSGFQQNRVIQL